MKSKNGKQFLYIVKTSNLVYLKEYMSWKTTLVIILQGRLSTMQKQY